MAKCTGVRCPMQHGYKVDECNHTDCPYRTEPITNADRIRAMSDEKLCEFLGHYSFFEMCDEGCDACTYKGNCDERLLEWLKQPVEDESDG